MIILAVLLRVTSDPLPRANAFKNVVLGAANAVAASGSSCSGTCSWSAAVPLFVGLLVGGRIGPSVVRRAPVRPLQVLIGVAALGLAVVLAIEAYA